MNSRETFDEVATPQPIDPDRSTARGAQQLAASVNPDTAATLNGSFRQSFQLLRDRYDCNSEAYLNGAICKIEYLDVIEQINRSMSDLIASGMPDGPGNGVSALPAVKRRPVAKGKGPQAAGKRKVAANTPCDADFVAVVQRACARIAGRT